MRASLLLASLLIAGTYAEAQRISDYVRMWVTGGSDWEYGWVAGLDSARLHIRHPAQEVAYRLIEVERLDVLRRRNVGFELLAGAAGSIGGYALAAALHHDKRPLTTSRGLDLALFAGLGVLVNGIRVVKQPYCWRRLRG